MIKNLQTTTDLKKTVLKNYTKSKNLNPKSYTIDKLRSEQWKIYEDSYEALLKNLALSSLNKDSLIKNIALSELGQILEVENIGDKLMVSSDTDVAEMSCVDEATQIGEFCDEETLDKCKCSTVFDSNKPPYMIDIPGSAALTYECSDYYSKDSSTTAEILEIENRNLEKLSQRIISWCQNRKVRKFTVTYHYGCGAINRRLKHHPEICQTGELETAKACAINTAKKISEFAQKINYTLEVSTAFINDKEMCKLRPVNMHNAIGTIGCLDSRVLAYKLDSLVHANFFDVFIFSDLKYESESPEVINEIVDEAVRNIKLTVNISTGKHGWGKNHFGIKRPYPIILFTANQEQSLEAYLVFSNLLKNIEDRYKSSLDFYLIRTDL